MKEYIWQSMNLSHNVRLQIYCQYNKSSLYLYWPLLMLAMLTQPINHICDINSLKEIYGTWLVGSHRHFRLLQYLQLTGENCTIITGNWQFNLLKVNSKFSRR